MRKRMQRRRLYYHWARETYLDLKLWFARRRQNRARRRQNPVKTLARRKAAGNPYDLHDFHELPPAGFYLLPEEVADSCLPPEVRQHVGRLLSEQWEDFDWPASDSPVVHASKLDAIFEDK